MSMRARTLEPRSSRRSHLTRDLLVRAPLAPPRARSFSLTLSSRCSRTNVTSLHPSRPPIPPSGTFPEGSALGSLAGTTIDDEETLHAPLAEAPAARAPERCLCLLASSSLARRSLPSLVVKTAWFREGGSTLLLMAEL